MNLLLKSLSIPLSPKRIRKIFQENPALATSTTFLGAVLRYFCYAHVVTEYIVDITACVGPSMLPTINESGDVFVCENITRRFGEWEKGMVVVATHPKDPHGSVCKRILGLPGDKVCTNPDSFGVKKFETLSKGQVWLQGDNLSNSTDSRSYGAVPIALIRSKVIARVWPPTQAKIVDHAYDPDCWPKEMALMPTRSTVTDEKVGCGIEAVEDGSTLSIKVGDDEALPQTEGITKIDIAE